MNDAYATAFKLLTLGFSVIPSGGGDKGKSPLVNWRDHQTTPPDESQLKAWESQLRPHLWGIVTNDRVAVIDADTRETRTVLEAELGEPHVTTPRGGAHWYIDTAGHPMKTIAGLLPGVDVRGVGGFVNIAGGKYQIKRLPVPGDTLIPYTKLPQRVLAALNGSKPALKAKQGPPIAEGQRNSRLASIAGAMRRKGADQGAIEAALLETNASQCRPPLSEHEVFTIAGSVSRYEPKPNAAQSGHFNLTDLGNAERLAGQHRGTIRYCWETGQWLIWTSQVWKWDNGPIIKAIAKQTARAIYNEAAKAGSTDEAKKLAEHAHRSESKARLSSMIELAQAEDGIPVQLSELNSNPWLLNCRNGTINLITSNLQKHNATDLITLQVPVDYAPDAKCPNWLKFLALVTGGDTDLQAYLQKAVGYSLTGNTRAQVLFLLYGLGQNGKGTFTNTIRAILAGYACRLDAEDLMLGDRHQKGGPKEGIADLQSARLAVGSEIQDGRQLNTSLVKDISGQDSVKARRLYEHEVEFIPQCKLWLYGNHKPVIKDTTLSIWRRVKLIPFTATIPESERVDDYAERYLKPEWRGILAWAVQGCLLWQREGLKDAESVKSATASYRADEDTLGDFVIDRCILETGAAITKAEMKTLYARWCEDNKVDPVIQKTFKALLIEKGVIDWRGTGGVRTWKGIRARGKTDDLSDKSDNSTSELNVSDKTRLDSPKPSPATRADKESLPKTQSELSLLSLDTSELPDCLDPTPLPDYAAALGMPVEDALTIWRSKGAPLIHVPGGNILDLAKFLAAPGAPGSHRQAVKTWLEKHTEGNGQC